LLNLKGDLYKNITKIYMSLFILIIICSSIVFFLVYADAITNKIHITNTELLDQISDNIELRLQYIDQELLKYIENDRELKKYMDNNYNSDSEFGNTIIDVQKKLNFMKNANEYIQSIYIYSKNSDKILTDGSLMDENLFYDKSFISEINNNNNYYLWKSTRRVDDGGINKNIITLVRPYPTTKYIEAIRGFIAINIDENVLNGVISKVTPSELGEIMVVDMDGFIVSSIKKPEIGQQLENKDMELLKNPEGIIFDKENVMFFKNSVYTNWIYICVLSKNLMYKPLYGIILITVIISVLLIISSVYVNNFFGKLTYKPLTELLKNISKSIKKDTFSEDENILEIGKDVRDLILGQEKLELQIKESVPAIKYKLMLELLMGHKINYVDLKVYFEMIGLKLYKENFVVFVIKFDDGAKEKDKEEYIIDKINLEYVIQTYMDEIGYGICSEMNNNFVSIISFEDSDEKNSIFSVLGIAQIITEEMKNKFECYVSISIGGFYKELQNIQASYKEALEAMKYSIIMEKGSVIFIEDIRNKADKRIYKFNDRINLIISIMIQRDMDEINRKLNSMFDEIVQEKFPPNTIYQISVQIIIRAIEEIVNMGIPAKQLLGNDYMNEYYNINDMLSSFDSVKDIRRFVANVLECFIEILKDKSILIENDYSVTADIITYINENYFESDLSLNKLSEEFKLSTAYISSLIKQKTGQTFMEYILNIRINQAKTLLRTTRMPIKDISEKVGYTTYHSFMRIFDKYVGVTPSEYRNNRV